MYQPLPLLILREFKGQYNKFDSEFSVGHHGHKLWPDPYVHVRLLIKKQVQDAEGVSSPVLD